jgi:quinolinate synthase
MYFAAGDEVEAARTYVLSTEGMVDHVRSSPRKEFVIATETGILHRLRKEVGDLDKRFFAVSERAICRYMKMVTLDKVLRSLREDVHLVSVPEAVAARARLALTRMVSLG